MDLGFGKPLPEGLNFVGGGWRQDHRGFDIAVPQGTPVFALADGFVTNASATPFGDMGIYAVVSHPSGVASRYLHFSKLLVSAGQPVSRGDQIGLTGNTGLSAGPHLHIDLKVPSPDVLAEIVSEVGEPATGFEQNVTGFGTGIPGEPWIPSDGYSAQVQANALSNGIPLYQPRGVESVVATHGKYLLIGGAAVLAYLWYRD